MTVAELLERVSSAELGEWKAFERSHGPLGRGYAEEMLAAILDELRRLPGAISVIMGADPDDVEEPIPTRRPPDVYLSGEEDEDEDGDDPLEC